MTDREQDPARGGTPSLADSVAAWTPPWARSEPSGEAGEASPAVPADGDATSVEAGAPSVAEGGGASAGDAVSADGSASVGGSAGADGATDAGSAPGATPAGTEGSVDDENAGDEPGSAGTVGPAPTEDGMPAADGMSGGSESADEDDGMPTGAVSADGAPPADGTVAAEGLADGTSAGAVAELPYDGDPARQVAGDPVATAEYGAGPDAPVQDAGEAVPGGDGDPADHAEAAAVDGADRSGAAEPADTGAHGTGADGGEGGPAPAPDLPTDGADPATDAPDLAAGDAESPAGGAEPAADGADRAADGADPAAGGAESAAGEAEPAADSGAGEARALPELDDPETLRAALEAILIVVDEPVSEVVLAQVLERPTATVAAAVRELAESYTRQRRGFELRQAAGGWRIYTRDDFAPYVERFVLDGQQVRLTQAALETLAVVAYKQPVSRSRVSAIRGVNCDGVVRTLLTRGLIEECGAEPESGAYLYRTTTLFLERMGINSTDELPDLAPFLPDELPEEAS